MWVKRTAIGVMAVLSAIFCAEIPGALARGANGKMDAGTSCSVVAASFKGERAEDVSEATAAITATMQSLDDAHVQKGEASLLAGMSGEDKSFVLAAAAALCQDHVDWTLGHAARDGYEGMRAIALNLSGKPDRAAPKGPLIVAPIEEIALAPRKYVGKPVEVRGLFCYYADVGDYRCNAVNQESPMAVVFAKAITPDAARQAIEANCDTAEKAIRSQRCRVTLRFSYDEDDVDQDLVGGSIDRIIVRPDTAEAILTGGRR